MSYTQHAAAKIGSSAPVGHMPPDGEAAREARRMARLGHLEILRVIGMEMAAALGHAVAGRTEYDIAAFARVQDPALAFSRIAHAVRRIVALEDRLDEDAETHAARVAQERLKKKKHTVRETVRHAYRKSAPDMDREEREDLLDDLFDDYGDIDYRGSLAEIVTRICADLGIKPDLTLWLEEDGTDDGDRADPGGAKARPVKPKVEYPKPAPVRPLHAGRNGHDPP